MLHPLDAAPVDTHTQIIVSQRSQSYYIGLMSGTSLDGVDAVLAAVGSHSCTVLGSAFSAFPDTLKQQLLALNASGDNEIVQSYIAANQLSRIYAECIAKLLEQSNVKKTDIMAIGCHGQTIRHRPDLGFTVQIGNAALLAELTGITVIADFRSRDIAAGGQGAPLVPAFHQAAFGAHDQRRTIVNIGGISNLSYLAPQGVTGFDCGPGNLLMDGWALKHLGQPYDKNGQWASTGSILPELLATLLAHPFFMMAPPKSTGRDDFHMDWLESYLQPHYAAADVQATLLELTAVSIATAIQQYCANTSEIYLCGGGAFNTTLVHRLRTLLHPCSVALTNDLGIPASLVEAAAFAWLARQTLAGIPGNLPSVTGARGQRILGAIYPA